MLSLSKYAIFLQNANFCIAVQSSFTKLKTTLRPSVSLSIMVSVYGYTGLLQDAYYWQLCLVSGTYPHTIRRSFLGRFFFVYPSLFLSKCLMTMPRNITWRRSQSHSGGGINRSRQEDRAVISILTHSLVRSIFTVLVGCIAGRDRY